MAIYGNDGQVEDSIRMALRRCVMVRVWLVVVGS